MATFSAMRAGWMKPCGVSVTPKPRRMFSVTWLSAPSTASDAGQCERFSRKWCSTIHDRVEPELVGQLDLLDRLRGTPACSASRWPYGMGLVRPRLRHVDLVQQVELHERREGNANDVDAARRTHRARGAPRPRRAPGARGRWRRPAGHRRRRHRRGGPDRWRALHRVRARHRRRPRSCTSTVAGSGSAPHAAGAPSAAASPPRPTPGWCSSTTAWLPSTRSRRHSVTHSRCTTRSPPTAAPSTGAATQPGVGSPPRSLVACLQRGVPVPTRLVLISPWVDLTQTAGTFASRADTDIMFSKQSGDDASALYLQGHDPRDPLASPQFADVTGFPPTQIFAGGMETLLDDSLELAARIAARGQRHRARGRPRPAARVPVPRARQRTRSRRARRDRALPHPRLTRGAAPARERLGRFGHRIRRRHGIGRRREVRCVGRARDAAVVRASRRGARRRWERTSFAARPNARSTAGGRNVVRIWRPRAARRAPTYKIPPTASEIARSSMPIFSFCGTMPTSAPMTHAT